MSQKPPDLIAKEILRHHAAGVHPDVVVLLQEEIAETIKAERELFSLRAAAAWLKQLGATEVMYVWGLLCLLVGAWVWFGVGQALVSVGGCLIFAAQLNAWLRDRGGPNAV